MKKLVKMVRNFAEEIVSNLERLYNMNSAICIAC